MSRWPERSIAERFWEKVDKNGSLIPGHESLGPCWLWTAHLSTTGSYAQFSISSGNTVKGYRWAWIEINGPIPDGLEPDHLCHTYNLSCPGGSCIHRTCVNPSHLELVTRSENTYRGRSPSSLCRDRIFCDYGHPFDDGNTSQRSGGGRRCKICTNYAARLAFADKQKAVKEALAARPILSVRQAADFLEVSVGTVYTYRSRGWLPEPDNLRSGKFPEWLPETLEIWKAARVGQGFRADRALVH